MLSGRVTAELQMPLWVKGCNKLFLLKTKCKQLVRLIPVSDKDFLFFFFSSLLQFKTTAISHKAYRQKFGGVSIPTGPPGKSRAR